MAKALPKALCIGPKELSDALRSLKPEWDFQTHAATISEFWEKLSNGKINPDLQIVFILDGLFDPKGVDKDFEQVVAYLAPHCFLGILSYKPNYRDNIREQVEIAAYNTGAESDLLYYFIDRDKPEKSINNSIANYINSSDNSETVGVLTGRVSEEDQQKLHDERERIKNENPLDEMTDEDEESAFLGQIVSVTSSKGGSGKSTIAVSLAAYLSHASEESVRDGLEQRPLKILILDLDVRDGQLGFMTGNASPTVIHLRTKGELNPNNIREAVIHSSRLKCDLILAPKRPKHSEDTPPEFYLELMTQLRRMYDYIILDTSVNYLDPLLEKVAYPTSTQIVFVTDIVNTSVMSMARWIREVIAPQDKGGMGINPKKVGIVVNKVIANVGMPGERIANASMGLPVITLIPSSPKLIAHAANRASMEVILKHNDIRVAVRKLAKAIVGNKYNLSDNLRI